MHAATPASSNHMKLQDDLFIGTPSLAWEKSDAMPSTPCGKVHPAVERASTARQCARARASQQAAGRLVIGSDNTTLTRTFDGAQLAALRRLVAKHAEAVGLDEERADGLLRDFLEQYFPIPAPWEK